MNEAWRKPMPSTERWPDMPLSDKCMDPVDRARAALYEPMPPTYGEVERRVAKAIREAELSIIKEIESRVEFLRAALQS